MNTPRYHCIPGLPRAGSTLLSARSVAIHERDACVSYHEG